jgi:4-hydroxy-tetrahydrodipicolinate reductase
MPSADQPVRISLIAPHGRMGRAIVEAIGESPGFALAADDGDVLVDFSSPSALAANLERARSTRTPLLIGTTGLDESADLHIASAAKEVAVLRAANTSLGIALLVELVERAGSVLGPDWDVEILETHHRMKSDAPSGTALLLGEAAAHGRGSKLDPEFARCGTGLTRGTGTIGFSSLRGGTAAGDHDVLFLGSQERLILSHRAENRMIFARGALVAARFLVGKPAGLYSMRDVVSQL